MALSERGTKATMRSEEPKERSGFGNITSDDPQAAAFNPPEPVSCEYCGAMRYTRGIHLGSRIMWAPYGPEHCTCPVGEAAYQAEKAEQERLECERKQAEEDHKMRNRIRKIIGESGMRDRFLSRTFESFEVMNDNKRAFKAVRAYADNFAAMTPQKGNPAPGRNGIFISGGVGTGKTHLAAAIANQLMHQGTPVICMTMIDLLERIKRTYASAKDDEVSVLTLYKSVPLLIIDDMGKEPPTEWAVSTIYNIINSRYEAYLPIVVTTNYDDAVLINRMTPTTTKDPMTAEATVDRLREMCVGIPMTGPSWRSR